ncbi:MAG: RAMP superfamily CRISPR-associated protein [Candidatus Hodarchaeota archaeon]
MSKKGKKKGSNSSKNLVNPSVVLKVRAYTSICKPLNGSMPRSNQSTFLRLQPIKYQYKDGKEFKEEHVEAYHIKGLRGAVRHAVMNVCYNQGLEVCHSSDKKEDKEKRSLIPQGFHVLGECVNGSRKEECITHAIFGSKGHEGKLRVFTYPIANVKHKTTQFSVGVQSVQLATENRVCMSFDNRPIQDFKEKYFSGEFTFELDVTKLNATERGLIIDSLMVLEKLGRGFNAGYGLVKVQEFQLVKRVVKRVPVMEGDKFIIHEDIAEEPLTKEVFEAMEAWEQYLS